MANDQPRRVLGNLQKLGGASRGILNADAMKSIAPDSFIEPVMRSRIDVCGRLQRGMKSGVEHRHLRRLGSRLGSNDDSIHGLDGRKLQPIVRWCEFCLLADRGA